MSDTTQLEQGSGDWMRARLGNATASRMADICARTKSGYGASRDTYMMELLVERLTGIVQEHYVNDAMQWGIEQEDYARAAYEARKGVAVIQVGYIPHPEIAHTGASPDGRVGDRGLIEIKCPTTRVHLETLLSGIIDSKYQLQMTWQLECERREWCDFVSYDPRLPSELQFFCKRFVPDALFMDEQCKEVVKFLAELDELEARARAYREE